GRGPAAGAPAAPAPCAGGRPVRSAPGSARTPVPVPPPARRSHSPPARRTRRPVACGTPTEPCRSWPRSRPPDRAPECPRCATYRYPHTPCPVTPSYHPERDRTRRSSTFAPRRERPPRLRLVLGGFRLRRRPAVAHRDLREPGQTLEQLAQLGTHVLLLLGELLELLPGRAGGPLGLGAGLPHQPLGLRRRLLAELLCLCPRRVERLGRLLLRLHPPGLGQLLHLPRPLLGRARAPLRGLDHLLDAG